METIFSMAGWEMLLRWFHFLAGITWIGLLYYFNLVQTPFFGTADPAVRSGMVRSLVPNALWWFRWGAMITFLTGWLIILTRWGHQGIPLSTMTLILTGGIMGTLMWANVWFVIWPAQKVVIASAQQVSTGGQAIPEAAARGQRAGLASRTNTVLSLGMLFFMGAQTHLPALAKGANLTLYWLVVFAILVLAEANALLGPGLPTQKPLATVRGTLHAGFGLTVVMIALAALCA